MKTLQEKFWEGDFGNRYIQRNQNSKGIYTIVRDLIKNKITINSALELGANVGINLDALKKVYPKAKMHGVEINKAACDIGKKKHKYYNKSAYDFKTKKKFDLVFSSGVLIHQNPKNLKKFYQKLYSLSKKYIYIAEYFNPTPVEIDYRNKKKLLFKRDFAKEFWETYPQIKLLDYGFHWKEDPLLKNNCDNENWFLFKKK
jgi:spore coat polysaccharide biosynthesis protein SpsF